MLFHHALAEQPAQHGADQNRRHSRDEAAVVDGRKQCIDVGGILAAGGQVGNVGVLHEPERQNRPGQTVGEDDIADQQQLFTAELAPGGDEICQQAADDVGGEGQHKVAGHKEEQTHDKAHDRDTAEFLQFGGQQHIHAAGDERRQRGQYDVAHTRQQCAGEGDDRDEHEVESRENAD